jgi:hypothetical protein
MTTSWMRVGWRSSYSTAQASESPVKAHVSPGTSYFLYYFLMVSSLVYLHIYFVLQLGLVRLWVLTR